MTGNGFQSTLVRLNSKKLQNSHFQAIKLPFFRENHVNDNKVEFLDQTGVRLSDGHLARILHVAV